MESGAARCEDEEIFRGERFFCDFLLEHLRGLRASVIKELEQRRQ